MALRRRRRETAELRQQLDDAVGELERALSQLDEQGSFRVIAAQLRLLLGPSRGDGLLYRLAEAAGVELPPVWMSRPPEPSAAMRAALGNQLDRMELVLAFGPGMYDTAEEAPPGSEPISLADALERPCLSVHDPETGEEEQVSWIGAVLMVANRLAVHADEEIPVILDRLDNLIVVNGVPGGFRHVLRRVGSVAVSRGRIVLSS